MGTRLQRQTCSHVNSPYLSIARGSHVLPLWLKYYCRSPRENIRHAEAVSLLSSWLRANHFNTNKEHISERISDSHIHTYIHTYIIYIYVSILNSLVDIVILSFFVRPIAEKIAM